jgi:hypothetical protein
MALGKVLMGGGGATDALAAVLAKLSYTGSLQSMLKLRESKLYALIVLESSGVMTVERHGRGRYLALRRGRGGSNARNNTAGAAGAAGIP